MQYWQFVNWEPVPLESALKSRVAVAIAAYENGDKNAIGENPLLWHYGAIRAE